MCCCNRYPGDCPGCPGSCGFNLLPHGNYVTTTHVKTSVSPNSWFCDLGTFLLTFGTAGVLALLLFGEPKTAETPAQTEPLPPGSSLVEPIY